MTLHFKEHTHIHTDKQHFDIKQASMIVQEKEPLSPLKKKGCKSQAICTLFLFRFRGVGRIFKRRTLDITNSRNPLHALKASPHYSAPLTPFPFHYLCRGADELRFGWRR